MDALSGLSQFVLDFVSSDHKTDHFVTARLLESTPSVWTSQMEYVRWRHEVAGTLGVDAMAVQLVGSARLGYSLNPSKNFKLFDESSDLDVAIISPDIFETSWRELREIMDSSIPKDRKGYVRKLVFEECIALDIVLPHLSFGQSWSKAKDEFLRPLGSDFASRDVNYRVYRNHSSLRKYQIKSVEAAESRAYEERLL